MTREILNTLLLGLLLVVPGVQAAQQVVPDKSRVSFVYKQMNVAAEGSFVRFRAEAKFLPQQPEQSKASLVIMPASIDTGNSEGNEIAVGAEWFDAKRFPEVRFVTTRVAPAGTGRYALWGNLTVKGITRPVSAYFTARNEGENLWRLEGSVPLKRLDFRLGEGDWADVSTLANTVEVKFSMLLSGQP